MSMGAVEFAPAKVNLTLRAGRARADGYHPLDSLVVFADWGDEVTAREADGLALALTGNGAEPLWEEPRNLVLKAAWALRAAAGKPELGAHLTLSKQLPVSAGLGGGSSDAAAALRALNRLWDLGFSLKQLSEIGSTVGADVPACVHARPLRMSGIGEVIAPLAAWPSLSAVIVNPGTRLSTTDVFAAFDAGAPAPLKPGPAAAAGDLESALGRLAACGNDLQAPAIGLCPQIAEALEALDGAGAALSRMSGSGASCFGLFADDEAAGQAARAISAAHKDWIVRSVRFGGAA